MVWVRRRLGHGQLAASGLGFFHQGQKPLWQRQVAGKQMLGVYLSVWVHRRLLPAVLTLKPLWRRQVAGKQMVGVYLSVWVHRRLLPAVRGVQVTAVGTGVLGYLGNKGSPPARTPQRSTLYVQHRSPLLGVGLVLAVGVPRQVLAGAGGCSCRCSGRCLVAISSGIQELMARCPPLQVLWRRGCACTTPACAWWPRT